MKTPTRRQILPAGGKELYELMRSDHEPVFISVFRRDEVEEKRIRHSDTLVMDWALDPMLYFWPVEKQHVVVWLYKPPNKEQLERLSKALLRDGARWVTASVRDLPGRTIQQHWGDDVGFMRERYAPSVPA